MIPKIIHYCWFGGNPLPESAYKCIESWKKYCPDYQICRWDENNFDISFNDYVKDAYEAKKWAYVSDVARLKILYDYGGIYLDTDVELLKPLDGLLTNQGYMGVESTGSVNSGLGCGAIACHPLIGELLHDYDSRIFDSENLVSCPVLTTTILERKGFKKSDKIQIIDGLTIYPIEYFAPINLTTRKLYVTEKTISIHRYDASWQSEKKRRDTELRKRCCKIFGDKFGLRIYGHLAAINAEGMRKYIWRHLQ